MKRFLAPLLALGTASLLAAAEPAKPPAETKTKGPSRADLEICCDDDAAPAAKDAKPADPKSSDAKPDAAKPAKKK